MASVVYQIDKKTGIKYAYESTSYWDKDKKAPRSTRRYLGKVDPETGEIIPSRKASAPITISEADVTEIVRLRTRLSELEKKLEGVEKERDQALKRVRKQQEHLQEITAIVKHAVKEK